MDYTVGSVADLISGKNTPNKPKVLKETLPKPSVNADSSQELNSASVPKTTPVKIEETTNSSHKIKRQRLKKHDKRTRSMKNKDVKNSENNASLMVIDHKLLKDVEQVASESSSDNQEDNKLNDDYVYKGKRKTQKGNVNKGIHDVSVNWQSPLIKKEVDSRTIFVGNVGIAVKKTQLLKFFGKFGKVQSVRLRCATPADPGVSKRVAVIKKLLHPKRATLHSYITFENREDALKALEVNGTKYKEHHLRVQMCDDTEKPNAKKAIFVGNLPFDAEDDDLWEAFEQFGLIRSVRVVRNAATGMGIGIGYVNFDSADSVEFALQMKDISVKNKVVRVKRYVEGNKNRRKGRDEHKRVLNSPDEQANSTLKQKNFRAPNTGENRKLERKQPFRYWNQTEDQEKLKPKYEEKPKLKYQGQKDKFKANASTITVKNSVFQGSKSNKKKQKPKVNKGFIQKMKLSQKIAPRAAKL